MNWRSRLAFFLQDAGGNAVILMCLCSGLLFGVVALGVDGGNLFLVKSRLQSAADAAALAGADQLPDSASAQSTALSLAFDNVPQAYGSVTNNSNIKIGNWNAGSRAFTAGGSPANAVEATLLRTGANANPVPTYFAGVIGISAEDVIATAIAVNKPPTFCFILLDPTASGAFIGKGGGTVEVPSCGVQINSSSSSALTLTNNSVLQASEICIVGSNSGQQPIGTLKTGCPSLPDPLAYVPEPTPGSCQSWQSGSIVNPGTYCDKSISISGVNLNPGIYYFEGSSVGLSGTVTGSGVTIFLDANSSIDFKSNLSATLSAPASGIYKGILIFQSRNTPTSTTEILNGGSTVSLTGAIYTPTASWNFAGSASGSEVASLSYFVADTVSDTGSSAFSFSNGSNVSPFGFQHTTLVQ